MAQHLMMDGFRGSRSEMENVQGIYDLMSTLPSIIGAKAVMPPFVLPYFDGSNPDDGGVSAFIMLERGHATLHTFSTRRCSFFDALAPEAFDAELVAQHVNDAMGHRDHDTFLARRGGPLQVQQPGGLAPDKDFGPHLMIDVQGYEGPSDMDGVFALLDTLPEKVSMTPIIRPYVIRTGPFLSAMTMIAESHIAMHLVPGSALIDVFSCKFFDVDRVLPILLGLFPGWHVSHALVSRGSNYVARRSQDGDSLIGGLPVGGFVSCPQ